MVASTALQNSTIVCCHHLCLEHVRVGESFCDMSGVWGLSTHNKAIVSSSAHTPFRESDRGPLGKWAGAFGSAINFPQLNAWDEICRVPRHATHE
jgi:hypothetical protein